MKLKAYILFIFFGIGIDIVFIVGEIMSGNNLAEFFGVIDLNKDWEWRENLIDNVFILHGNFLSGGLGGLLSCEINEFFGDF